MLSEEDKDKIREKFRQQGYDYDVAVLAFQLEYDRAIKEYNEMRK